MTDIGTLLAEKSLARQQETARQLKAAELASEGVIPELYELLQSNINSYNSYPGIDKILSIAHHTDKASGEESLRITSPQIKSLRIAIKAFNLHIANEDVQFPSAFDYEEYSIVRVDGFHLFNHQINCMFKGFSMERLAERILDRAINWGSPTWKRGQ